MTADNALTFLGLDGTVSRSTLNNRIKAARAQGTYDSVLKKKAEHILKTLDTKVGLVINVDTDDDDDASQSSRNISPVTTTMTTSFSSSDACSTTITTRALQDEE